MRYIGGMSKYKKLTHAVYYCVYHLVWVPKYRYRVLDGAIKEMLEHDIRSLSEWLGCEVKELSIQMDHVHAVISIVPKVSVSEYMGTIKGKTAIKIFKSYPVVRDKPYWGNHFWSRGYCVSTIGLDETKIRRYVRYQEENERLDEDDEQQFGLFQRPKP